MSYGGGSGWPQGFAGGPPPFQPNYQQQHPQHGGGYNSNRRGGYRSPPGNRSEPYNRGGHSRRGNTHARGHQHHGHRRDQPTDISRFVKPSFFENPWRYLEPQPEASSKPPQPELLPQAPVPVADPPSAPSTTTETTSSASLSKLGLNLPPPKSDSKPSSSKFSDFLSKLPPPKPSGDSSSVDT